MAAASTTGSLFGGGSTGFAFGSGATSTGFGASTIGGSSLGGSTLGTGGFSAIRPFGASTTTTSSLSTPFGKSTAAVAGTTTGFAFGGLGSTAGTSFSGMNAAKTTATAPTLGIFGQTTQTGQTPGLTTGLTLGGTPGASTATGLTLGGLQTTSGLGGGLFKSSAANTTTTSLLGPSATGLGLGTSTGLGSLGGFTAVKTTAVTSGTASAAFAGLGGTGTSTGVATTGTVAGVAGRQGDVKDMLPGPLNEIVEHIKKYVKEQKEHRDEISRVSGSALDKVREETISLRQTLALVSNSIQRDGCALENLKMDVSQELKNAEIAQRTNDIPPALQHENIAPQEYFQRMVESFEERMLMYRKQIEIMESHLASLSQGQALTPQDLSEVMHKVHETFIALAAQLHEIHEGVRVQKEQFLNYRRAYFKDTTDVFAGSTKDLSKTSTEFGIGPSPFRIMPNNSAAAMAATMNITAPHALGLSSLQTNPSGLTGALGTAGALGMGLQGTSLGSSFGTSLVPGTVNPTVGTAFGTPLGTSTLGTSALGTTGGFGSTSLTGGFGTPGLGTSTVGTLNSAGTGLGGSGFGVGTSAFTAQPKFQLQRPPTGNKRGKRR